MLTSESSKSDDSGYTAASIHEMKNASPNSGFVGIDPKVEKERLNTQIETEEILVGDYETKAKLIKRISGGTFGEVYLGEIVEGKSQVAVKLEPQNSWIQPTLMNEGNVYRKLGYNVERIPYLHWFGFYGSNHAFAGMILELLGDNLYQVWLQQHQEFSLKTMLMLIDETLTCLETIHSRGCIHRDISPNNFSISHHSSPHQKIHIFDFGHALILPRQGQMVFRSTSQFSSLNRSIKVTGTPRFASLFAHKVALPSYRDDLESLGYVWVYFMKGRLPWQGVKASSHEEKLLRIGKNKEDISLEVLCDRLPDEFIAYFTYVRNLNYLQRPDYDEIRNMFKNLARTKDIQYDGKYDWS